MPNGWRVTGTRGTDDLVGGRLVQVMEVQIETDDGATNIFRVPAAQYTPDTVRAVVNEWYDRHRAIINL